MLGNSEAGFELDQRSRLSGCTSLMACELGTALLVDGGFLGFARKTSYELFFLAVKTKNMPRGRGFS